jgi:hypothetical protein
LKSIVTRSGLTSREPAMLIATLLVTEVSSSSRECGSLTPGAETAQAALRRLGQHSYAHDDFRVSFPIDKLGIADL